MPSFGTLVGWLAQRDGYTGAVPPYVITPAPHCDSTVYITPGQFGGCLGAKYDPFVVNGDPNAEGFRSSGPFAWRPASPRERLDWAAPLAGAVERRTQRTCRRRPSASTT